VGRFRGDLPHGGAGQARREPLVAARRVRGRHLVVHTQRRWSMPELEVAASIQTIERTQCMLELVKPFYLVVDAKALVRCYSMTAGLTGGGRARRAGARLPLGVIPLAVPVLLRRSAASRTGRKVATHRPSRNGGDALKMGATMPSSRRATQHTHTCNCSGDSSKSQLPAQRCSGAASASCSTPIPRWT
jgi:hypothetical protein